MRENIEKLIQDNEISLEWDYYTILLWFVLYFIRI